MKRRRLRKLLSMILAVVMMLSMSAVAFAADPITTITMSDTTSTYTAYKLMTLTVSGDDGTDDHNPTNYAYTVNSTYIDAIVEGLSTVNSVNSNSTITSSSTNAEIVAAIAALSDDEARTFANAVYAYITSNNLTLTANSDYYDATSGEFTVPYGYYLIAETAAGSSGTYSLVMLDTADKSSISVTNKEDKVSMTKKVMDTNDSTGVDTDYQDTADYDIGDSVPFRLTGTVDSNINSYTNGYYYAFHDTMSAGLTFDSTSVVVTITTTENGTETAYVVDSSCYSVVTGSSDGCTFEVVINDLLSCTKNGASIPMDNTTTVTVDFTATLNSSADLGNTGNPNTARLQYSNNVYDKDDTTYTEWDTVVVYTYEMIINKVIKGTTTPLTGAGFTLYKKVDITEFASGVNYYIIGTNGFEKAGSTYDDSEVYYILKGEATASGTDNNVFNWTGLDDGDYVLVESTVPAGYNAIADMYFTISATHEPSNGVTPVAGSDINSFSGDYLTDLSGTKDTSQSGADISFTSGSTSGSLDGSLSANVENSSGSILPSTGGMGTTIFHIVGGIMAFGAVVLLVTRVRMRKSK